jgi:hypothetical protein
LSTTEWDNLSSGLIGAAIGAVIGSVLGFLGSVLLNWLGERSKRKGAGRALLAEMVSNMTALNYVGDHGPAGYSQNVWETQLPLVAALLDWKELQIVAEPYLLAAEPLFGFSLADEKRELGFQVGQSSGGSSMARVLQSGSYAREAGEILKKSKMELGKARDKFAEAVVLLRDKLLTQSEAQALTLSIQNRDGGEWCEVFVDDDRVLGFLPVPS